MAAAKNMLGQRLVKEGILTEKQLNQAVIRQQESGERLGDVLISMGFITKEHLSTFFKTNKHTKLGELLVEEQILSQEQLKEALTYQKSNGGRIGDICIALGFLTEAELTQALGSTKHQKSRLGEALVDDGYITQEQLNQALELQKRSGGKLGEILLFLGYVDQEGLFRELANGNEMGRIGENVDLKKLKKLPYQMASKYSAIIIGKRNKTYILAAENRLADTALEEISSYLNAPVEQVLATSSEMISYWEQLYKKRQKHKSVFDLYDEQPDNSAIVTFTSPQIAVIIGIFITILIGIITDWHGTLFVINIIFQILYAIMTILKLLIVLKGEAKNTQIKFSEKRLREIDEKELPVYTLLIPVYKETEVVKDLINNIGAFDYPQYKLDVRILLEEDDIETIKVVMDMNLPSNYTPIIVPTSNPQTKPKACNYGLLRARGKYVVIYDAEDRPEPDQLKKAYLAFTTLPEEYVCVQAKLNYFNSNHNFLTKLFTQEYSMWFELLLVGIMQMDVPVPLGGTSNHFKIDFLKEVGGWDPFNVTEDADLGIRLFKFNYKTAILDSNTWEEANSNVFNWIRQRSRWIKGYMQTWLVHMRHPVRLYKTLGLKGYIGYHAMILGTPLLPLINPFFWAMMIIWYATGAGWIKDLFPGIFYYIASFQLVFGNFMFTYINIMGMYRVIRGCTVKRKNIFSYGLIKYALLTPVYWILMSIASYKALIQLIFKPFYWEKTEHGLTQDDDEEEEVYEKVTT